MLRAVPSFASLLNQFLCRTAPASAPCFDPAPRYLQRPVARAGALPRWYLTLRGPITALAAGAVLATLWHETAEQQAIHDAEHAASEVPIAFDSDPPAAAYR